MADKAVAIIAVTYNRLDLLKEEINSLREQTYKDAQIIVVNNGSTDDTLSWLQQQQDIITITQENLGGAGGFFTGMKYAAENGYKYCWVMDDDVICQPTALDELVSAYKALPNIGFVCSRVIGINGQPMNTPNINSLKADGYNDVIDYVANYALVKVIHATFVSVFLSTKTIFEVGLPLKEYFIWGDDVEYTRRISSKYPCFVACRSIVTHKRAIQKSLQLIQETNPRRIAMNFYKFRNELNNERKFKDWHMFLITFLKDIILLIKLLSHFKLRHAFIIVKSILSTITFRPKVQFPIENSK
ncbi:glycosyltransferase family 2 protein [Fibrobacter sp. UWB13]|uniref:glycosyltransferase family 2 protein n=1 Tax=Fibrobacter sp. UWB13 TaxID=1896204 RepID=UPI000A0AD55D|nr:glycosyltransferase family 2 protein [Fibrobacter sp. UWB13]SMG24442.1 Glycosyltransferase, GT2 family [Fibrobacter sp. UWB13]